MSPELLVPPVETAQDPWQAAMDAVFEQKFVASALAEQAAEVVPLREEAVNFLSIAENLLGFEQAQRYAAEMCANHPHLQESVQDHMNAREAGHANDSHNHEEPELNDRKDNKKGNKTDKDNKSKEGRRKRTLSFIARLLPGLFAKG